MKKRISEIASPLKTNGLFLAVDEVGAPEWQAAKSGGSKVDLVRARLEQQIRDQSTNVRVVKDGNRLDIKAKVTGDFILSDIKF